MFHLRNQHARVLVAVATTPGTMGRSNRSPTVQCLQFDRSLSLREISDLRERQAPVIASCGTAVCVVSSLTRGEAVAARRDYDSTTD